MTESLVYVENGVLTHVCKHCKQNSGVPFNPDGREPSKYPHCIPGVVIFNDPDGKGFYTHIHFLDRTVETFYPHKVFESPENPFIIWGQRYLNPEQLAVPAAPIEFIQPLRDLGRAQ